MAAGMCMAGTVMALPVELDLSLLPGAGFADAYAVMVPMAGLTAPQAADRMFANSPAWVGRLMSLRDRVMVVFGVRQAGGGPFPVLSSHDQQIVLGLDDSHLDFRLVVSVAPQLGHSQVTVTTVVRTNNLLGRAYLVAIMPFHRAVARAMLTNLAISTQP